MKRHSTRWITCLLALCILFTISAAAGAAVTYPDTLYLQQDSSGTCTLSSTTMMIRARMYLSNNSNWSKVTESDVRNYGWLGGVGLRWSWTYTYEDCRVTIGREAVTEGIAAEELKALLDEHPEGIVLYVATVPHAVFLTDYEGDTFYCADPSPYYSGKRIPLAESYTASRVGDQAAVLASTYSYWYVSSYSIPEYIEEPDTEPETCDCTEDAAGKYICTASGSLNIRADHSTASQILGTIPSGATVTVTKANGEWAHIEYNGISGYAYMEYLKENRLPGDINGDGTISNADIVTMTRYIVGLYDANSETAMNVEKHGDLNNDGSITNNDLLRLARIAIGM